MKRAFVGGFVAVVAVVCAGALPAQAPEPEAQLGTGDPPLILASDLIGRPVRSANGEAVGQIDDLVLSPADRVTSAVLSMGGFFGIGERRIEVPYDKLVVAPNRSTVLVTMSRDQVAAKPEFSNPSREPTAGGAASTGEPAAAQPQDAKPGSARPVGLAAARDLFASSAARAGTESAVPIHMIRRADDVAKKNGPTDAKAAQPAR